MTLNDKISVVEFFDFILPLHMSKAIRPSFNVQFSFVNTPTKCNRLIAVESLVILVRVPTHNSVSKEFSRIKSYIIRIGDIVYLIITNPRRVLVIIHM